MKQYNLCFRLKKSHGPSFLRTLMCGQKTWNTYLRLNGVPICLTLPPPEPRPSNWTRVQTLEWLEHNPIRNVADVEFLTNEVLRLRDLLVRAQQQLGHESGTAGSDGQRGGRNWQGIVPYLCIIMCFTQDDVKSPFLARANTRSRQELDARDSDIK
jgi:hypothetical protein